VSQFRRRRLASAVDFIQKETLAGQLGRQSAGRQPPAPVPHRSPRGIQPRLGSQPQQILHRDDREAANRDTKRFQSRLRSAKLRHGQASVEDVDYRTARRLDKALFQQLATGRWIAEHRNLLLTGPCGVGKSWLSCALAQKACRDGYTVHYARVPRLFADLELAHGDGRFAKLFRTLVKADLLILDDWGPDRLTANHRRDLMEIVEDRYGRGSTLITSQLPLDKWHEVVGEPTLS